MPNAGVSWYEFFARSAGMAGADGRTQVAPKRSPAAYLGLTRNGARGYVAHRLGAIAAIN